jgi:hypothetical protein
MSPLEHADRLLEIARIGERAAIGAEQRLVFRVVDRGGLEHRSRLRALAVLAQRVGVAGSRCRHRADWRGRRSPSVSLSRRQSASLRWTGSEIDPVMSVEPVVLQPASPPAISTASATVP